MKLEDYKIGEGSSGEIGGEVITITADIGLNILLVSGFSNKQVNNLMIIMSAMMNAKLEAYFGRFDQTRQQLNSISAIQYSNQQSTPQQPTTSPPVQLIITTTKPEIRVEEVEYFDLEHQQEQGNELVVNTGKHVFYRDVYIFMNRLKDLAAIRSNPNNVKQVITVCFRDLVLM